VSDGDRLGFSSKRKSAKYKNSNFLRDPARIIHNADAGLRDQFVHSKIVHAALLLLMPEAVITDPDPSFHHQPEAQATFWAVQQRPNKL
jgi:hypothetical protein